MEYHSYDVIQESEAHVQTVFRISSAEKKTDSCLPEDILYLRISAEGNPNFWTVSFMTYSICGPAGRIVSRASAVENTKKALRQAVAETVRNLPDSSVRNQCKIRDNMFCGKYSPRFFDTFNRRHPAEAVLKHVISSEAFRKGKAISCYLSMRGEIDTTSIAREILLSGEMTLL